MTIRDQSEVPGSLVALVGELCRRAGTEPSELELRAALAPLSPAEEKVLRRSLNAGPLGKPLGPMAFSDIARGTDPQVAVARELSGYYALLVERDALAAMVGKPARPAEKPRPAPVAADEPPPAKVLARPKPAATPTAAKKKQPARVDQTRASHILGLYAYHRDGPKVARALGLSLEELDAEVTLHGVRRKAARLVGGLDSDLPAAQPVGATKSGPPLRRRGGKKISAPEPVKAEPPPQPEPTAPAAPPGAAEAEQARELRALISEVGPRRNLLAARLGHKGSPLPVKVLLARFRAAGLEREFGQRERDLIRALYSRHRGASKAVAGELGLPLAEVTELVKERGLAREIEALREEKRREARQKPWPRERIHGVLHDRDYLADVGVLAELEVEVGTRTRLAWEKLVAGGKSGQKAVEALARELLLKPDDARLLARRLGLR